MLYTLSGGILGVFAGFLICLKYDLSFGYEGKQRRGQHFHLPGEALVVIVLCGTAGTFLGFGYGASSLFQGTHIVQKAIRAIQ